MERFNGGFIVYISTLVMRQVKDDFERLCAIASRINQKEFKLKELRFKQGLLA